MGRAEKYLSQARRIELYEEQMRQFGSFKTAAAAELKALAARVAELEEGVDVALMGIRDRLIALESAWTGSWLERRRARRALK